MNNEASKQGSDLPEASFDADITGVRGYITDRLSYRDLVEMMAERGLKVALAGSL
jgi:transposase-like protein